MLSNCIAKDTRHEYQAICIVHNETTTGCNDVNLKMTCVLIDFLAIGVTTDIAAVRHILDRYNHPALLMVDGVSSIASIPFKMDEWKVGMFSLSRKHFFLLIVVNIDLAITGSQKGFMLPAGLGMVCASPRALERSKKVCIQL